MALAPTADMPAVESAFVETPSPLNPLGAKGIGESGAIGVPPAIANALANATGKRFAHLPLTPDRIYADLPAQ